MLPQYTAWIGTLDKLEPPEDVAADWDAYITASYETRDAIKDNPDLALDPDATEFATVNEQADALGLGAECYAGPTRRPDALRKAAGAVAAGRPHPPAALA